MNEGYHLAGWTVGGAQSNYWDAATHSFGLAGLIVENENGGYVSITANIVADEPENPDTGKTLKIYWAIDNPEGASWTQSENSSWTETIAWSDRYNTFQIPGLEVNEGYHLAGWTVGGAQSNYWDAATHSFGLTGLIVEDENGGYVSITANIVADEPEDPDVGKTLKIYWAINNPEGASWIQSENSSWTETIAWSDRYNTFQIPGLEVNEGYHLAGWTVGGAQSNYWSAEAHSFGLAGLIVEDENGGFVSITANIVADKPEDPDTGKTLRIYWAIDNKDGATWTDIDNSEDRTELYSWADRENGLGILGLNVKDGYHLAGWTVNGSSSDYWDANTQTFTLNGNYVEDEAGGFLSITANIVADDIPVDPSDSYTVTFYAGSHGSLSGTTRFEINAGSSMSDSGHTVPNVNTHSNYSFTGWWGSDGRTYTSSEVRNLVINSNMTFTAQYKHTGGDGDGDSDTETYAVYYHSNYGSDARKFGGHYEENDKVKVHDNSWWDRDNYRFLGWNTEKDGSGEDYDPDDTFRMPDEDVHLYAQWRRTASDPSDSGTDRWLETQDHRLYMVGYPDNTFGPNRNMTRAEAAQMFYALLLDQNVSYTETFSDVPSDAWYAEAVNTLAALGMIDGYPDGTFRPDATITRAEFCVIALAFAYEPESFDCNFYDVSVNDWFYDYVAQATSYGWISGSNGIFRPNDAITRAEVSVIANNMLGRAADEDYVDRHEDELVTFPDVPRSYWAYYSIMETTNSHDYTKTNGMENWR